MRAQPPSSANRPSNVSGNDAVARVAAASAAICFGASVVVTRFVVAEARPLTLACLRYLIGSTCLLLAVRGVAYRRFAPRDLAAVAGLGALFFGAFPWSFSAALTYIPSSRVAVELASMPLLTLVISSARGYDRVTAPKVVGQLLAAAGLWIALSPASSASLGADAWRGDVLAFLTAAIGALFNVFSRPYLTRYPSLHVTAIAMLAGALSLTPLALSQGMLSQLPAFSTSAWLAIAFLGTLGGALGFGLWIWALERSTPSRVAVFISLNPITAVLLGALVLHEPITFRFIGGFAIVLTGIALASRRPPSR